MNISIFGLGYVGCVSLGCLARNGHNVIGVDVSETKVKQINSGMPTIIEKDIDHIIREEHNKCRISATTDYSKAILETDVSIIAVGTPSSNTGHLNLQYIFKVAENFGRILRTKDKFHIIAIRSTVLPGTSAKFAEIIEEFSGKKRNVDFAMVSNPEFLREGTAVHDYYNPPLTLLGSDHPEAAETVASLYRQLPAEVVITDVKVAELMKYVNNTFHALKVSFGNEIGNICAALNIDSHKVIDIFCKDKVLNISPYYFKPGFAYGGSCLPKDLKGLQTLAHDHYVKTPLIESIDKTNELQITRAVEVIQQTKKRKLGFLGLSFKAGTDDLRNSPAVTLIETLLGKGYEIAIYDKNVHLSNLTGTNKEYIDTHIPHLSKLMKSQISEVMRESELIIVNNKEKEYVDVLMNVEWEHPVIDMVRLPEDIRKKKNYKGINW
ncbi:MAG: UDP-glucose/GDP-mannose dehydrogenase family protein [Chitinophagaceae bacterium]|nr:UDP-glucose/GDP-mannose dehydrogenase family protein [Chitinophagaceae bacterium]